MACMSVILSVLWGRPFLHACLALLCAIAGSIALNLARMAVVIFTTAKYGWGLDQGMMHELLGLGVFLLGLTVIVCSDRGVLFLTNPAAGVPAVSSAGRLDAAPPVQPLRRSSRWLGTAAVAVLLLLMLAVGMEAAQSFRAGQRPPPALLAVEFKMPDKLGEWQLQPGETVINEVLGQGVRNQVWLFTNGERSLFLAVAHPFTGFHDTRQCYRNAGWEVLGSHPPSSSWVGLEGLLITELNHPSRLQTALVGLVVLDHQGRQQAFPDQPRSYLTEARWLSGFRFMRPASEEKAGDTLVLQAFSPDTAPGNGPEQRIAEVMTAFQEVIREQLRQMPTPEKP
jgi:exosortase/archaeosortase family protein